MAPLEPEGLEDCPDVVFLPRAILCSSADSEILEWISARLGCRLYTCASPLLYPENAPMPNTDALDWPLECNAERQAQFLDAIDDERPAGCSGAQPSPGSS